MAYKHAALHIDEEDIDDGNTELKEYYERNLPQLQSFPVRFIDPTVISQIAYLLHATEQDIYKWEEYATKMGITNRRLLDKIKVTVNWGNRMGPPLMIVMKEYLSTRNGNFGDIIKALLETERFDVLKLIQPDVKGMLESKNGVNNLCFSEMKPLGCGSLGRTPFINFKMPRQPNCMAASQSASERGDQFENLSSVDLKPSPCEDSRTFENQTLQQCSLITNSRNVSLDEYSSDSFKSPAGKSLTPIPSAPPAERVSLLIIHTDTEFDRNTAVQLSARLTARGFIVICLYEIENHISTESLDSLDICFQEVDFIVPVVSTGFLQQIYPRNDDRYLESRYAQYNTYLFRLILNEYRNNRCRNLRVKPVIVPDMNRKLLVRENILSTSFRLWDEIETLIKVLIDSKELNLHSQHR